MPPGMVARNRRSGAASQQCQEKRLAPKMPSRHKVKLRQNLFDDTPMDVGEPKIASLESIR